MAEGILLKTIHGKSVYETVGELVQPSHTAVLVLGLQNDGYGDFPPSQSDIDPSLIRKMASHLAQFIQESRRAGVLVVWIQDPLEEARRSESAPWVYFQTKRRKSVTGPTELPLSRRWRNQFQKRFEALTEEPVVKKYRLNAFVGSNLDLILRSNGIQTVIVTGMTTEASVQTTTRGAYHQDYHAVLLSDCVASWNRELHEASLEMMSSQCDCVTSDEILAQWSRS